MLEIGRATTREERLSWDPDEALVIAREKQERAVVANAMCDQLQAVGVPLESLEMCIMFWSRALDGLDPGPVPPRRLERLDSDLAFERKQSPVMAQWLDALRGRSTTAHDLDWNIQFLLQVRQTWVLTTALTR